MTHSPPWVGPRPLADGERLFARRVEVRRLGDLLLAERLVVLHGPEGVGKTSLLQAGLLPWLRRKGYETLPPGRVASPLPAVIGGLRSSSPLCARLKLSLLAGSAAPERALAQARQSLNELLRDLAGPQPGRELVLVIDQLEEIFPLAGRNRMTLERFFVELGEALDAPGRLCVLCTRDAALASLLSYARLLPTRLRHRFSLDVLDAEGAMEAIRGPAADAGLELDEGLARRIALELARLPPATDTPQALRTGSVDPMSLQLTCAGLWASSPEDCSTWAKALAVLPPPDRGLTEHVTSCLRLAAEGKPVVERRVREWVTASFIEGKPGQRVLGVQAAMSGPPPPWAAQLLRCGLLRDHPGVEGPWLELAHSRLVDAVRRSNEAWRRESLSPLQHQAALWEEQGRLDELLLAPELLARQENVDRSTLNAVERDFLVASLQSLDALRRGHRRRKTLRRLFLLLGLAVVLGLGALSGVLRLQAQRSEEHAAEAAGLRQAAEEERVRAQAAERAAQRVARQARSQVLTVKVQQTPDLRQDRALLLLVQALRFDPENRAAAESLRGLAEQPHLLRYLPGQGGPLSALVHGRGPSKNALFGASRDGRVAVWDTLRGRSVSLPARGHQAPVRALALSSDGAALASVDETGLVVLWTLSEQHPRLRPASLGEGGGRRASPAPAEVRSWALAFEGPGRVLLATGDKLGRLSLWRADFQGAPEVAARLAHFKAGDYAYPIAALSLSADGRALVATNSVGERWVWESPAEAPTEGPQRGYSQLNKPQWREPRASRFSPGGELLATVWRKGPVELSRARKRGRGDRVLWQRSLPGFSGPPSTLAFGPGPSLGFADPGGALVLLPDAREAPDAQLVRLGRQRSVDAMVFDPSGHSLYAAGANGALMQWQLEPRAPRSGESKASEPAALVELMERACGIANRNLDLSEWRQLLDPRWPYRCSCPGLPRGQGAPPCDPLVR